MALVASNLRSQRAITAFQQVRCFALAGRKPVDGRAADWFIFPFEREGKDVNLNWALNRVNIIPRADAFHNPRHQLLSERLQQKADNKEVKLLGVKYKSECPTLEAGTEQLSFDAYDNAEQKIQELLSRVGCDLYVATGSVGSFRDATVTVRVVTDHPGVCMLAQNLLIPTPYIKYEGNESPIPPVTIYVTGKLNNFAGVQYQEGDGGSLIGATGVLCGPAGVNQGSLVEAIRVTTTALLLEKEGVIPLPASVLRKGARTALLFNTSEKQIAEAHSLGALYCANGAVLCTTKGVASMWGSITVPNPSVTPSMKKGSFSTTVDEFSTVCIPTDNLAYLPTVALFMGEKASGKMNADEVQKALVNLGVEEDVVARFTDAMKSGNIVTEGVSSVKAAVEKVV